MPKKKTKKPIDKKWLALITKIPNPVLIRYAAALLAKKRKVRAGGGVWAEHNPDTSRCRCEHCNTVRARRAKRLAA